MTTLNEADPFAKATVVKDVPFSYDLHRWCYTNCFGKYTEHRRMGDTTSFLFLEPDDAVMFKHTFGGK